MSTICWHRGVLSASGVVNVGAVTPTRGGPSLGWMAAQKNLDDIGRRHGRAQFLDERDHQLGKAFQLSGRAGNRRAKLVTIDAGRRLRVEV